MEQISELIGLQIREVYKRTGMEESFSIYSEGHMFVPMPLKVAHFCF